MDEFIDLCILCGCDYVDSIRGIGHKTAFKLMKKHRTLEKVSFFIFYFLFSFFHFFQGIYPSSPFFRFLRA